MADKVVDTKVPVMFQATDKFENEDSRFLGVKIWLMHTGRNLNGSSFSEESVIKALPSLANTPILAFMEENSDGENDFSDHRTEVHVENGEFKEKYVGQAIGVIPETNNAQFEYRVGDDGIQRQYLTVEGLVWAKWEDPIEILRNFNVVGQSMELHNEYKGKYDEDGVFHFEEFKFFGACALGKDTMPAMKNATIEIDFSETHQQTIKQKLEEFYTHFSTDSKDSEEEESVEKQVEEKVVETELEEITKEAEATEEEVKEVETELEEKEEVVEQEAPVLENEEVEVEEATKVEETIETVEKAEFDALQEKFDLAQAELSELRTYKRNVEIAELKGKFTNKLAEEKLDEIITQMADADLIEIEKEIFATIGRLEFETKQVAPAPKKDVVKVQVQEKEEVKPSFYGTLFSKK
mgnify:CR=1 FL=1